MAAEYRTPLIARFGQFTVDLESGEVLKSGIRIKLQEQPFQLLAVLLEQPGRVVTREELRQRLWPADTFVDFDRSLNTAASKLREALGDSAENPRFIETLPRRGYRFVAPAELISELGEEAPHPEPPARQRSAWERFRRWAIPGLAALAALAAGILAGGWLRPSAEPGGPRVLRFAYTPDISIESRPVISPDGRRIAYVSATGKLEVQDLDRQFARQIEGTEGAQHPFWAPGSDWIAFGVRQELRKVSMNGSPVERICKLPHLGVFGGGTWSPDGRAIAFTMFRNGLYQVPASGGAPARVLAHDHVETPHFLPSGRRGRALLFAAGEGSLRPEHSINLIFLDTGERRVISRATANWPAPVYSPSGHIVYASMAGDTSQLWALPFSTQTAKATGEAFPIARLASQGPSVGKDGTLVYLDPGDVRRQLVWRDRSGKKLGPVAGPWADVQMPSLSRDGSRLAAVVVLNGYYDVVVMDLARDVTTRLTFDAWSESHPLWRPGGSQLTFNSWMKGTADIFTKPADGSGEARELLAGPEWDQAEDWSPDGRFLVFRRMRPDGLGDLWYLRARAKGYEAHPVIARPDTDEAGAKFSPDGRLLAYASNQSGRYEVYVREFPEGGGPWQVSTHGGVQPRWRRDGKEIFYVEGDTLVAAAVQTSPTFAVPAREQLFVCKGCFEGLAHRYDVSPDGRRFVVPESLDGARQPAVRVVQNWFAEFAHRRPPAG